MNDRDLIDLYAFRTMMGHLNFKKITEKRRRERLRIKVALKTIKSWQKEGEAKIESLRRSPSEVRQEV